MAWYFAFFFLSGFCSILYELVWLRLSMAQFGVTTAQVSIVLSVFMAGMGVGSWAAGAISRRFGKRISFSPLRLYAATELLIGCSALVVPWELARGRSIAEALTGSAALSSSAHYVASGFVVALIMVPWSTCMGATIPFAMLAIERDGRYEKRRSFSFLYVSNVVGAIAGALIPLYFIEMYGFHGALHVGACVNALIAVAAFALTRQSSDPKNESAKADDASPAKPPTRGTMTLLFLTGLATMGMEIIWVRLYTPYVGAIVYSFSTILVSYLVGTFLGSAAYRDTKRAWDPDKVTTWFALAALGLFPLVTADPRFSLPPALRVLLGVAPFSAGIGFLTPMLVDRFSDGDPDRAGRGYAINVLGCIVGPLVSGFVLLPLFGERTSMLLFVLPWFVVGATRVKTDAGDSKAQALRFAGLAVTLGIFFFTNDWETTFPKREVLRDSTATVIATGEGMKRKIITNGVGMTYLTPITKMMAHVTLSSMDHEPKNVLIICFGMGTTFRSSLSWGVDTTAVELVPSVPKFFWYFHSDADRVLASPLAHIVADDGRRYLERSTEKYDAILIDPPPPVSAAGSSLLYSEEFYAVIKAHLKEGGIFQQWLPWADPTVQASVARALHDAFPNVKVYGSVEDWGWHFLASMKPLPNRTPAELAARMPPAALADASEWGSTAEAQLDHMLKSETSTEKLMALSPNTPALQDDRPVNEYFLFRIIAQRFFGASP